MRPTARGLAVLLLVGLAIAAAALSGQRSLNAVAAPLLGAMAYGTVQCWRADDPTVRLSAVQPGYPGDTREIGVSLEGSGVVHVTSDWPAGVEGEAVDAVVAPPETLAVEVTLSERGVHELGGLTVRRRDALGLVQVPTSITEPTTAVVYPRIHRVGTHEALADLFADEHGIERQEFDSLREYEPGDPLRRIHWKSSAKHDEFLVVEFAPSNRAERLTIEAAAVPGRADEMASAVGSIALLALRAGLEVGVTLPGGGLPPGSGDTHRANLLALLARTEAGPTPETDQDRADVSVEASHRTTTVRMGGRLLTFDELTSSREGAPPREVALA